MNSKSGGNFRVLLIDDSTELLEQAKFYLEKEDERLNIKTSTSAEEALDKIEKREYDAIVSDYKMPNVNGLELLKILREDREEEIPFIVFTGKGREQVAMEALNLGANRYLQKGGDPKSQYQVLANAIINEIKNYNREQNLRESEEKYRTLVEQSHDGVYIYRGNKFLFVNDRVCEISGYEEEELYDMKLWDLVHPKDRERVKEIGRKRFAEDEEAPNTYEARILTKSGDTRHLEFSVTRIDYGGEPAAMGSARDTTERRKAEKELRESEKRYRTIVEQSHDAIIIYREDRVLFVNDRVCEITGYNREEIYEMNAWRMFPPEERERVKELGKVERIKKLDERREDEEETPIFEAPVLTKDGKIKHCEFAVTVIDYEDKPAVMGLARDITERRQKEEWLRKVRKRYKELFEGANEMVITTDQEGYVKRVSRRVGEVSGYSEDELVGESILKIAHPDNREKYIEFWKKIREGEQPVYELKGTTKQGETTYLDARGRPIIENGEVVEIQYNAQDITERKKAEERQDFLHSMLRHDLKNKLQIADGVIDLLKDSDLSEDQRQYLEKNKKTIDDSFELIEKVRALRKIDKEEIREIEIRPVIEKVVERQGTEASEKGISIETEVIKSEVVGGELLNELFSNLLGNSISHSKCDKIRISSAEMNDECIVSVEDNGKGIPDEDKDKIFERRFKKGENAGSGIGLHLVRKIAENYGGSVEVKDSELGGARFDVHLQKA